MTHHYIFVHLSKTSNEAGPRLDTDLQWTRPGKQGGNICMRWYHRLHPCHWALQIRSYSRILEALYSRPVPAEDSELLSGQCQRSGNRSPLLLHVAMELLTLCPAKPRSVVEDIYDHQLYDQILLDAMHAGYRGAMPTDQKIVAAGHQDRR